MAYEFVYESEVKQYRSDCSKTLKKTCELLRAKGISAQFSLVGSGARNMITRNRDKMCIRDRPTGRPVVDASWMGPHSLLGKRSHQGLIDMC